MGLGSRYSLVVVVVFLNLAPQLSVSSSSMYSETNSVGNLLQTSATGPGFGHSCGNRGQVTPWMVDDRFNNITQLNQGIRHRRSLMDRIYRIVRIDRPGAVSPLNLVNSKDDNCGTSCRNLSRISLVRSLSVRADARYWPN